jgi:hypothetical protein
VEDKAGMRGTLGRGALDGTELGRPGEVHEVEVELARLAFVLSVRGGSEGKDGEEDARS